MKVYAIGFIWVVLSGSNVRGWLGVDDGVVVASGISKTLRSS